MININDKNWEKLRINDIYKFLKDDNDETFFYEFKNDDVKPAKLIEEISAFCNTYGGYIFLGVDDDKNISGCTKWNEQRIHITIHNGITPIPNFDVKKFKTSDGKIIFVIKVDEGVLPPYITNTGKIYERVSSGSFPINESNKLTQLYYRRQDQFKKIENKISIPRITNDVTTPNNFCGYLDLGFSLTCNNLMEFQKRFFKIDLEEVANIIKKSNTNFSITRVGYSIVITIGKSESNQNGKKILSRAGMNNFIEIMCDGSVRCRAILCTGTDDDLASINQILFINGDFKEIYEYIVGNKFHKNFINAYKYEKLTVLKQFVPVFDLKHSDKYKEIYDNYMENHNIKYGNNLIVEGNRIPKNDYLCIDKKYFSDCNIKFDNDNLISLLFRTQHMLLGFIDDFPEVEVD